MTKVIEARAHGIGPHTCEKLQSYWRGWGQELRGTKAGKLERSQIKEGFLC